MIKICLSAFYKGLQQAQTDIAKIRMFIKTVSIRSVTLGLSKRPHFVIKNDTISKFYPQ